MARSQIRSAEALKKVRERQRELDRADDERREARRKRIAEASATVMVELGRYEDAAAALERATAEVGAAMRRLMAEDVDVDRAAALLDLDAAEVKRFAKADKPASVRTAKAGGSDSEATVTAMAGRSAGQQRPTAVSSGGTDASRRTG
jgi:hypothetical protein